MADIDKTYNVMDSALRLARALRRSAPRHGHMFPPAVERTLVTIYSNNGLSSGELCEALGVRPSSVSEMIDKMEKAGLAVRKVDEEDKRIVRIYLTEQGAGPAKKIADERSARLAGLEACFEEGEAEKFCELADKLSAHLQDAEPEDRPPFGHGPHGRGFGPHGCHGPKGPGFGPQGPGFGPQGPQFGMHGCHGHKGPGFGPFGPEHRDPHCPHHRARGGWDGHRAHNEFC